MSLESPNTYAEWFWSHGLQSSVQEQEKYEKELTPTVGSIIDALHMRDFINPELAGFLGTVASPPAAAWGQILGRFLSECADSVVGSALQPALQDFNYKMTEWFADLRIDKETAAILWSRKKITEEMYDSRMKSSGFKPEEGAAFYESKRPYPTLPDIFMYARYHDAPDDPRNKVLDLFDVSVTDYDLWYWLSLQKLNTDQTLSLYKRGLYTDWDTIVELAQIGWDQTDRPRVMDLAYSIPNALLLVQADLLNEVPDETLMKDISIADIHPNYAGKYLDAVMTKPATQDIIDFTLRRDPSLGGLSSELRRIGVHPRYHDLYKTLAYQIPPVQDLITMAVREAFSPEIASRFGQYEDFPRDFEDWAEKKGLTREWAQRYWASHWSLPSPQQGFEMLHRGVINEQELNLLLRALDIMPFWRDKLVQISYNPLTRVDVRRMYSLGVIREDEVTKAYSDIGYTEENAKRLTEFTVKQTLQSQSKFSPSNAVTAYKNRLITVSDLRRVLREINVKDDAIEHIVRTATYQRDWDYKQDQVTAIGNLFKKDRLDETETRNNLNALQLPSEEINVLIQKWQARAEEEKEPTWTTAQTLSFLKKGLIDRTRAEIEFRLLGYNAERIDVYLRSATTEQA